MPASPSEATKGAGTLKVAELVSGYDGNRVVSDVSFALEAGSITAILGPNGAGKSTLLRTISGMVPAQSGSIVLDGTDVTRAAPHERTASGLCHIPEGRGIFRSLSVRENLRLQAIGTDSGNDFDEVVDAFPVLGTRMSQQAGTLSGGEQQMLALSRVIVQRPEVILVDEASLGLAPRMVESIFCFLERLSRTGISLILVDQLVSEALALASYTHIMHKGELIFSGPPSELDKGEMFQQYLGGSS